MNVNNAKPGAELNRGSKGFIDAQAERSTSFCRTVLWVLISGACYYLATEIAWELCFSHSKVSLFFPPYAVLVSILLIVPVRHWWAYTLAAVCGHLVAAEQAHWPLAFALHSEFFDAVQNVSAAAGLRIFMKPPFKFATLRDAIVFVLVAVVLVPFGTAFWGAALTLSYHYGTNYWVEWHKLGISNGATAIVLVPAILLGAHHLSAGRTKVKPGRLFEMVFLGASILIVGVFVFDKPPAGPDISPALLYAPIPFLIWAALRFGPGGMSGALLVITLQAIWGAMRGRGPFLMQSPAENAFALQSFLLVISMPLLFLAVLVQEQKRSKDALHESERSMELAASAAELGLWSWDIVSDVFWATGQAHALYGFTASERIDFNQILLKLHPDDLEPLTHAVAKSMNGDGEYENEHRIVLPGGAVRWIAARGRVEFNSAGKPVLMHGVALDITTRKQAETEVLQQRSELAHLSRVTMLGELSGSLAHELNQPLTAILSNAQAAQRFLAHDKVHLGELREILADIVAEDKRAGEVIRRLRLLLKKGEVQYQPVDVSKLVLEVLKLVRSDLMNHGVTAQTELALDLPFLHADPLQFQQVLLNLLMNACDAMSGVATAERQLIVRAKLTADQYVEVSVSDCGHGIPAGKLEQIFEPFFTTKAHGMGLGLSLCRTIITAHGGKLWAENNPERGATFFFTQPAAKS